MLSLLGASSWSEAGVAVRLVRLAAAHVHTTADRATGNTFQQQTAEDLWRTSTSLSPFSKQQGRAKGLPRRLNLNRGQKLGMGKMKMLWPGLNVQPNVDRGAKAFQRRMTDENYQNYLEQLASMRSTQGMNKMREKVTPLQRGWSGRYQQGKSFPRPISISGKEEYEGFLSILLESKVVTHMTKAGRTRRHSLLMVTGNQKGLAGFSLCGAEDARMESMQRAINRAGFRLMPINLYEGRTVYHNYFTQYGDSRLFVKQMAPGYGIRGHRVVKAICKVVGIKDLEVIIDGSNRNHLHITRAFFLGLLRQRTHQELADEKGLHLVELRSENDFYPKVVASPSSGKVRTKEDIPHDEILDFDLVSHDGKLPHIKDTAEKENTLVEKTNTYSKYLVKRYVSRHHREQRIRMMADHGAVQSHLTPLFPECVPVKRKSKEKSEDN